MKRLLIIDSGNTQNPPKQQPLHKKNNTTRATPEPKTKKKRFVHSFAHIKKEKGKMQPSPVVYSLS